MSKALDHHSTLELKNELPHWISHTVELPGAPLLEFLKHAPAPRAFWQGEHLPAFAGFGALETVTADGPERFKAVQARMAAFAQQGVVDENVPLPARPRWFGGFAFRSTHQQQGAWSAFPAAHFFMSRYQLACDHERAWLTVNGRVEPSSSPLKTLEKLQREAQELKGALAQRPEPDGHEVRVQTLEYLMDQPTWERLIRRVTGQIRSGELEKVVLAQACRALVEKPVDPLWMLSALGQRYPSCYRFLIEPAPGHAFFGATPELLAQVDGNHVETVAMASSIGRGKTPLEDEALAKQLLKNPKERHEHEVVLHAIRKNLQPLVRQLDAPAEPQVVKLNNIQHLRTKIQGELRQPYSLLSVVAALHPTPALGGTPRAAALQLIAEAEPFQRGWYASPVGWVDLEGNGVFAVAIRSALTLEREALLFAGAGIVADSDPRREWEEVQLKFQPILNALEKTG